MVKTICTQVLSHLLKVALNNDILHYLYSSAYSFTESHFENN